MKIKDLSDIELLKMYRLWRDLQSKSVQDTIFESKLEAEVLRRERKIGRCLCFDKEFV